MTMIERVARAIARCQRELGEEKWRYCLPEARAAIEAMRGPTDAMVDAAYGALPADGEEIRTDHIAAVWPAMIDAALNEQVSG